MSNSDTIAMVEELCEGFGIGSWADRRAGEYSHGMKQRIVMASAFLHKPKVILIDEPMVGLDPAGVKLVKKIMTDFCSNGGTVFLSTHTLANAEELCDRVAIIKSGVVVKLENMAQLTDGNVPLEEVFLSLTSEDGNS
jgi:ABC-2 type transport system ATP-binding protein